MVCVMNIGPPSSRRSAWESGRNWHLQPMRWLPRRLRAVSLATLAEVCSWWCQRNRTIPTAGGCPTIVGLIWLVHGDGGELFVHMCFTCRLVGFLPVAIASIDVRVNAGDGKLALGTCIGGDGWFGPADLMRW